MTTLVLFVPMFTILPPGRLPAGTLGNCDTVGKKTGISALGVGPKCVGGCTLGKKREKGGSCESMAAVLQSDIQNFTIIIELSVVVVRLLVI